MTITAEGAAKGRQGTKLHPQSVLFPAGSIGAFLGSASIPGCDHYAGTERFIRKAFALQIASEIAFDVTCDCEDGAAVGTEAAHAAMICDLIEERSLGAAAAGRVGLRIHDLSSPFWAKDLELILPRVSTKLAYVTVPKVRTLDEIARVSRLVSVLARKAGRTTQVPLHILIETPQAVRNVWDIAAHSSVSVLDFGLLDFMSEHHGIIPENCMRSPHQFEHALLRHAKTEICAAAAMYGKIAAHNITTDIAHPESAFADASRAREEFGFLRMWSIHPSQIEPILRAMTPEFSLAERAGKILLKAMESDWAPIRYENQLHDRASYRFLWTTLLQARLYSVPVGDEVEKAFFA